MAIHGMIDLETLDVFPTATVLSLGAVKFDPTSDADPYSELYLKILVDDQDHLGRTTSDSTIEWWGKQDPAIMEEAFDQTGAVTVEEALSQLNRWVVGVDELWGHGYGFDITILENMYRSYHYQTYAQGSSQRHANQSTQRSCRCLLSSKECANYL